MENLSIIANRLIRPAQIAAVLKYSEGQTADIITEIIDTDKISKADTAKFAPYLRASDTYQTLSNIWHFVKQNIKYKLDEFGYQYVKTPSRTWSDKFADCKSYSIFIASLLKNLNIPFYYRFVAWSTDADYTHVYIVVPLNGKLVILDDVLPRFNTEKPYSKKYDYDMTKIYQLSGIGAPATKLIDLGNKDISQITEGEMDLLIARDRLKTEKAIVEGMRGIGSVIAEKYQNSIDMINDAIAAVNEYQIGKIDDIDVELGLIAGQAVSGQYTIDKQISGIGDINERYKARLANRQKLKRDRIIKTRSLTHKQKENIWANKHISGNSYNPTVGKLKNIAKKVKAATKKAAKTTGKFAKKAGKVAVKVVKAAVKVVTYPQRLAIKGILEITLPKAAPFFLYLFITDPKVLEKCPAKVKAKRKKAEFIANFIVNGIGMKRPHFMGIVRNGILKQMGKSPENVIAEQMKGIAGVGVVPIVMAAITALIKIIPLIVNLFKKKSPGTVSIDDAPDSNDFQELSANEKKELTKEIKEQPENTSALNTQSENPELPLTDTNLPGLTTENNKPAKSKSFASSQTESSSTAYDNGETATQTETTSNANNSTAAAAAKGEDLNSGGKKVWSSI